MSFILPTSSSYVDKFPKQIPAFDPEVFEARTAFSHRVIPPTMWKIASHYDSFREIVIIAKMEGILDDPQADFTLFIPLDLHFPRTNVTKSLCDSSMAPPSRDTPEAWSSRAFGPRATGGSWSQSRDWPILSDTFSVRSVPSMQFGKARTIVNSLIIPQKLSSTMMIQSAFTNYQTRDPINTLLLETQHCVQFEPETYNKPPFGVIINGKSRIITPDIIASNGSVHTISSFPYSLPLWES
jgi:hypothetical protein